VERLAAEVDATLVWRPMLLGAVFKAHGGPMIPLFAMSDAKRAWMQRDMADLAEQHGVTLRWPSHFPLNTVAALRVSIAAPETVHAMYRAAWVDDRNIGDKAVLAAVLDEAGFDGAALLAATQDPAVKQTLRDNTERAVEIGVFGAPSFHVDDEMLFWGNDRMPMVRQACKGWRA
jgi:2-hydroxychromene-2-carboxylate isomerase